MQEYLYHQVYSPLSVEALALRHSLTSHLDLLGQVHVRVSNIFIMKSYILEALLMSMIELACSLTFAVGWGSFYSGYAGNADPEPGRCRRTDGKKWRCSRDAVADQKYCERHMNRGRHRSRKHVEGQSGHAAEAKPAVTPSQLATAVSGGGGSSRVAQTLSKFTKSTVGEACPAPFNMYGQLLALVCSSYQLISSREIHFRG